MKRITNCIVFPYIMARLFCIRTRAIFSICKERTRCLYIKNLQLNDCLMYPTNGDFRSSILMVPLDCIVRCNVFFCVVVTADGKEIMET